MPQSTAQPKAPVSISCPPAPDLLDTDADPEPGDDLELVPPRFLQRAVSLGAVIVPFLGLIAAVILLWGWGFGWVHLGLLLGGYVVTLLGVTVGYHRLFTHRSFKTNAVVKAILGITGSMAVQGPLLDWVATHRMHHQHSDDDHDPHSPHTHGKGILGVLRGAYHSHIGWFFKGEPPHMERYVRDLKSDRVVRWVSKLFSLWVVLGLLLPAVIALAITGTWTGAALGFIWGGLVRVFLVHHVSWSVNSVCHLWGARPFRSHDHSRNNPIFGVIAMGEGWHNTHHAFPTSARHGLRWYEIDFSYMVIRTLGFLGLATAIKVPTADRVAAKSRHTH